MCFPTRNTTELAEGRGLAGTEPGRTQEPEAKARKGLLEVQGCPSVSWESDQNYRKSRLAGRAGVLGFRYFLWWW